MITEFGDLFEKWTKKINRKMDEVDKEPTNSKSDGPKKELEYWKNKMRSLTFISE